MKKIFLFLFVLIVFFSFSISVFAAETFTVRYPVIDENWNGDFSIFSVDSIPSIGNYRYHITLRLFSLESSFSGVCSAFDFNGGAIVIPLSLVDKNFNVQILCAWVFDPSLLSSLGLSEPSFLLVNSDSMEINLLLGGSIFEFEKIESAGFADSVNSGLSSVISWIQSFALEFLSGELSPLMTVFVLAICIAALLFAVRYFYKICWGC